MKIYVSSTFEDLQEHRAAAIRALHQLGHEVVAMEYYGAGTAAPLAHVLDDVAGCDAYLGIVGWRYGYRPPSEGAPRLTGAKPGATSITEWEYRKAAAGKLEIMAFLVDERAPWPAHLIDGVSDPESADALRRFRRELQQERLVAYFSTPDSLASRVSTAVSTLRMRAEISRRILAPVLSDEEAPYLASDALYDSHVVDLLDFVSKSSEELSVTVDVGTTWWSTRLYLLAVVGMTLGRLQRIVLLDQGELIGVVSAEATRRTMLRLHDPDPFGANGGAPPPLAPRLRAFEERVPVRYEVGDLSEQLYQLVNAWSELVGTTDEQVNHYEVNKPNVVRWFGDALVRTPVRINEFETISVVELLRILDYPNDFVPVLEQRRRRTAIRLVDKAALNEQIARGTVRDMLDRIGLG
jgi:hypothetical protein